MIYELLGTGKENAKTTEELMKVCGFKHKRDLMYQIARERESGCLICSVTSGSGGFYIPDSIEELREFVCSMESRGKSIFRVLKTARAKLKEAEKKDNG